MGNNNIFEGALARFGKISMEFLHLGGLQGNHCEIWENLNGVPSHGGSLQGIHCEIWENLNGVPSLGGIHEGITVRFGKISMEFFHLGGFQGNQTVVPKVHVTSTRMDQ